MDIKFRGKPYKSDEWVFGSLHDYSPVGTSIIVNNDTDGTSISVMVKGYTIGQKSPFKDCKGVDIYDGDILTDKVEVDGEIVDSKRRVFFDTLTGQWMLDCSAAQDCSFGTSLFQELQDYEYSTMGA